VAAGPPPLLPPGGDRSLIGARPQVTHDLVEFQAFRRRRCRRPRRRRPRTRTPPHPAALRPRPRRTPPPPPPHPTVAAVRGGGRGRRRCARGCRPTSTRSSACPSARCGAATGPPPATRSVSCATSMDLPRTWRAGTTAPVTTAATTARPAAVRARAPRAVRRPQRSPQ
jgi:hypothetical protein